jgi:hypothetical protein
MDRPGRAAIARGRLVGIAVMVLRVSGLLLLTACTAPSARMPALSGVAAAQSVWLDCIAASTGSALFDKTEDVPGYAAAQCHAEARSMIAALERRDNINGLTWTMRRRDMVEQATMNTGREQACRMFVEFWRQPAPGCP